MAGDWVKWEIGLENKPEVVRMAALLGKSRKEVAVDCMTLWAWADRTIPEDTISESGSAFVTLSPCAGDNMAFIDTVVGTPLFADSISRVGWLRFRDERVEFPNFGRHNGETAKTRARNARNQKKKRQIPDVKKPPTTVASGADPPKDVTVLSPPRGDILVTRGEERRVSNTGGKETREASEPGYVAPLAYCVSAAVTAIEISGKLVEYHEDALRWESEFVRQWNITNGVSQRNSGDLDQPMRKALQARLCDPQWFWKRALAAFPLNVDSDWIPNLSWFLKPDSVSKILDGTFKPFTKGNGNDGRIGKGTGRGPQAIGPGQRFDPVGAAQRGVDEF